MDVVIITTFFKIECDFFIKKLRLSSNILEYTICELIKTPVKITQFLYFTLICFWACSNYSIQNTECTTKCWLSAY